MKQNRITSAGHSSNTYVSGCADKLVAGDIIVTNFWGVDEVCKVYRTVNGKELTIIRLESIVHKTAAKKDYCLATLGEDIIPGFPYKFLHRSKWYLVVDGSTS